jgi:chitodextrinase
LFDGSVPWPDVRIAEYSGLDTSAPFDVGGGATGVGTALDSGSVTTTTAAELIVGANELGNGTDQPGAGFTQRVYTAAAHILEDKIVSATGSYSATATQISSAYWVMVVATFRAAGGGGDTQAPTVPTGLDAVAVGSSQINLTWEPSTDDTDPEVTEYRVERCEGVGCSTFTQIGTSDVASFDDSGLTPSTSYSYRVRAVDTAMNSSGFSAIATAVTEAAPDTESPTAPTGFTVIPVSNSQIDLAWTASTDNVAVTAYVIERCPGVSCASFTPIATATTTTFSDSGLPAATTYRYRVRARDAVPNFSAYSSIQIATTQGSTDTVSPTAPSSLSGSAMSASEISLNWPASTDNVAVTSYLIERCEGAACSAFTQIGVVTSPGYGDSGLAGGTTYRFRVRASDAANNFSSYSPVASVTTVAGSGTAGSTTYQYDSFGRLKQVTVVPQ